MELYRRQKTIQEIKMEQTRSDIRSARAGLLDTQEIAADNAEQSLALMGRVAALDESSAAKDRQILDLQELVAALSEQAARIKGGEA